MRFCGNDLFSIDDQMEQLICPPYVCFKNSLFFCLECVCVCRDCLIPDTNFFNRNQARCRHYKSGERCQRNFKDQQTALGDLSTASWKRRPRNHLCGPSPKKQGKYSTYRYKREMATILIKSRE